MIKYLLVFALFLLAQYTSAETCYNRIPALSYENGPNMVYFCPTGWTHVLPENECRAVTACPDVVENTPECVEGYEKVYNNKDGSLYGCMIPCPSNEFRDHWSNGDPMNSCRIYCPLDMGVEIRDDQCQPLECYDEREELVILPDKPYRACLYKCPLGQERSLDKYGDLNCHVPSCPVGFHFEGDICVKDPEPEPDTCTTTVIGSINCLEIDVVGKLRELKHDLSIILDDILYTLIGTSDSLDNVNSGNPDNSENPDFGELDTSPLDAHVSINETDSSLLDLSLFSSNAFCPADRTLSIWATTYNFSYDTLCNALHKLSYLVLAIAFVAAAYIIVRE